MRHRKRGSSESPDDGQCTHAYIDTSIISVTGLLGIEAWTDYIGSYDSILRNDRYTERRMRDHYINSSYAPPKPCLVPWWDQGVFIKAVRMLSQLLGRQHGLVSNSNDRQNKYDVCWQWLISTRFENARWLFLNSRNYVHLKDDVLLADFIPVPFFIIKG